MINERLDDLFLEIETGAKLDRCNLRPLTTDSSIYEFNLWKDQRGWRGFCHREKSDEKKITWVIDKLDKGLGKVH